MGGNKPLYYMEVEKVITRNEISLAKHMSDMIPLHVGLMGHIDHGKTALAKVLSEGVFTAGLDKHPQSKERGITIDLGFTMFRLDNYLVTLVDAPGHADLIRSVVAGANIIDAAILTVAADEGPKIQTGEHIIVLQSMGIDRIVVAITKTDLADETRLETVESQARKILAESKFKRIEFVRVSAKTGEGMDELRQALLRILEPRSRDVGGAFLMPIDHAFNVRGFGTVTTGTILRGQIKIGDTVRLVPQGRSAKVRSIQTFGAARDQAQAGDRVGINVPDISPDDITRGDYLCEPGTLSTAQILLVHIEQNPLYTRGITRGMIMSAHVGMAEVTCESFPIRYVDDRRVLLETVNDEKEYDLILRTRRRIPSEPGTNVLLMRTDLKPTEMRIIGHGVVEEMSDSFVVYRQRRRTGTVMRVREDDVLVQGLAMHKEAAQHLRGREIVTSDNIRGVIGSTFGTKGVVVAKFERPIAEGVEVRLDDYIEERI